MEQAVSQSAEALTSSPYAIEVEDVSFSYEKNEVLKNVSFRLRQGEFLGIIGPNGGGKTTLVKLLLGLLQPDRGTIRVLGVAPTVARRRVGYVPQSMDLSRAFPISVMDVVLMGRLSRARMGRRYSRDDEEKARQVLQKVGMWEHHRQLIGKLSGGQKQRVFIARALATEPEILFLDEPTASVDPEFQVNLYDILQELNKEVTIVVITHDIGVVSSYMKSIACVNKHFIFHEGSHISQEMIDMAYQCPVDLVAHGLPHRVLRTHKEK